MQSLIARSLRLRVHDHVGDRRAVLGRIRSSISLAARAPRASGVAASRPSVRKATRPSSVSRKRSSRGAPPVASRDDRARPSRASTPPRRAAGVLRERLEVRLHRVDLGHRLADRVLDLLGDLRAPPRAAGRPAASDGARARCRPPTSRSARLWISRTPRHASAAACARSRTPASSSPARRGRRRRCRAARARPPPRPRRPRRDPGRRPRPGGTPITTSANWRPAGLAHAQAAQLDRRVDRRRSPRVAAASASAGARSMSTSTFRSHQARRAGEHERRATNSAAIESPLGVAGTARRTSPTSTATEPTRSLAEVERVRSERRARVAPRDASTRRSRGWRRSTITTHDHR